MLPLRPDAVGDTAGAAVTTLPLCAGSGANVAPTIPDRPLGHHDLFLCPTCEQLFIYLGAGGQTFVDIPIPDHVKR